MNVFLDNEASTDAIYARIKEAMGRADRDGGVVVICHARSVTARTWTLYLDEIKKQAFRLYRSRNCCNKSIELYCAVLRGG